MLLALYTLTLEKFITKVGLSVMKGLLHTW